MSQSQFCVSDSTSEPDALLVAACASLRQALKAHAEAATHIGVLDTVAVVHPSADAHARLNAAHRDALSIWQSIQSAARTIERTPATGALGRGAKVVAVHAYIKALGMKAGEIIELDLAKSLLADFAEVRHLFD